MSDRPLPPRDPAPPPLPSQDWRKAMVWICLVGVCIGFWIGVVFTVAEVVR